MLVKAGYKTEKNLGRRASFPTYADTYFAGSDGSFEVTNKIGAFDRSMQHHGM